MHLRRSARFTRRMPEQLSGSLRLLGSPHRTRHAVALRQTRNYRRAADSTDGCNRLALDGSVTIQRTTHAIRRSSSSDVLGIMEGTGSRGCRSTPFQKSPRHISFSPFFNKSVCNSVLLRIRLQEVHSDVARTPPRCPRSAIDCIPPSIARSNLRCGLWNDNPFSGERPSDCFPTD